MFGYTKPLLKWKEPGLVDRHYLQQLAPPSRFWRRYRFYIGAASFLFLPSLIPTFGGGLPSWLGLSEGAEALVHLILLLATIFGFSIMINRMTDLVRGYVVIDHRSISLYCASRDNPKRGATPLTWKYPDLHSFRIETVLLEGEKARTLALYRRLDVPPVRLEVAPEVSDEQIAEALRGRLPHRSEFEPLPGYVHRF